MNTMDISPKDEPIFAGTVATVGEDLLVDPKVYREITSRGRYDVKAAVADSLERIRKGDPTPEGKPRKAKKR